MRFLLLVLSAFFFLSLGSFAQVGQRSIATNPELSQRWYQIQAFRNFNKKTIRDAAIAAETPVDMPFVDDFSGHDVFADSTKWVKNSGVYIGDRFSNKAPSKGVATFDGIRINGQPYSTNLLANGPCDTLTSRPINMDGLTTIQRATVFLSFYLQEGHPFITQFNPDESDSLIVQFLNPNRDVWYTTRVFKKDSSKTTNFTYKSVKVEDSLVQDGFRFRFLNYGRQNGNFDLWNLDYVYLDYDRSAQDSSLTDVALAGILPGFFRGYRAIPADHYNNKRAATFSDSLSTDINNLSDNLLVYNAGVTADSIENAGRFSIGRYLRVNLPQTPLDARERRPLTATQVQLGAFLNGQPVEKTRAFRYTFALAPNPSFNNNTRNDTLTDIGHLEDYYAADDGSGELIHYVNGNLAGFVVKVNPLDTGSLTGMSLYFDPMSFSVNPTLTARIYVFRKLTGIDGATSDEVLYAKLVTLVQNGGNAYRFAFDRPISVGAEPYYIGYRQDVNDDNRLFIRADVNSGQAVIYTNAAGPWIKATSLYGQPMIRPYYQCIKCPVSVKPKITQAALKLAPNPVSMGAQVRVSGAYTTGHLVGVDGRQHILVPQPQGAHTYYTIPANIKAGLYVLQVATRLGQLSQARIRVQ